jgi:para-nitrobenzyl esterase
LAGDRGAFELDEQGLSERVNALLAEHAESVLQVYRDMRPDATPSQLYFAIASDRAYCARMMTLAEPRAELRGAPVYFYYLTWQSPAMGGRLGAPHALDVPLVFDNIRRSALTGSSERAQALADKMSDAWIAFARSGEPQTDALPYWQPYTAAERATLVLDDECRIERDPTRERRIAMQRALGLL